MIQQPTVSAIIPFVDEAPFLPDCLQSILRQDLQEFEVICVANSPDERTLEVVLRYQAEDERLRVLHCLERGAGAARNVGLAASRGKFIAMIDADDIVPDASSWSSLVEAANTTDADMARGNLLFLGPDRQLSRHETIGSQIWFDEPITTTYSVEPRLWLPIHHQAYLFRREYLHANRIDYPSLLKGQDQPFLLSALTRSERIAVTKRVTYAYRKGHHKDHRTSTVTALKHQKAALALMIRGLSPQAHAIQRHIIFLRAAAMLVEKTAALNPELLGEISDDLRQIGDVLKGVGRLDYAPYDLSRCITRLSSLEQFREVLPISTAPQGRGVPTI